MTDDWATALTTKLLDNTPELKHVTLREIMASARYGMNGSERLPNARIRVANASTQYSFAPAYRLHSHCNRLRGMLMPSGAANDHYYGYTPAEEVLGHHGSAREAVGDDVAIPSFQR